MQPDPEYINALLIGKLTGSISDPERKFIEELIDNDPSVKKVYAKLCQRFPPEDLNDGFLRFKTEDYWRDVTKAINQKVHKRVVILRKVTWAAAALIVILMGGYYLLNNLKLTQAGQEIAKSATVNTIQLQLAGGKTIDLSVQGKLSAEGTTLNNADKALTYTIDGAKAPAAGENILRVPMGKDYKISLEDGTEVWLNSETTLRFPFKFTGNKREITLDGEAFVKVAKNAARPFIVHTSNGSIQVLGTEFNVNTYEAEVMRVALVKGSVQVRAHEEEVIIKPGQEAVYTGKRKEISIGAFEADEVLSWREGIHYFHNATIREICHVFPRWYGIGIIIDNKQLESNRFSGILNRNEPLKGFLDVLKATTSINEYYFDSAGILHIK